MQNKFNVEQIAYGCGSGIDPAPPFQHLKVAYNKKMLYPADVVFYFRNDFSQLLSRSHRPAALRTVKP
jgi:hypothetical protein